MTAVFMEGIGVATPPYGATQKRLVHFISDALALPSEDARFVRRVGERSGIDHRFACILERETHDVEPLAQRFYPVAGVEPDLGLRMRAFVEHAGRLAVDAASRALRDASHAGTDSRTISHLVTFSCTGFASPGFDDAIVRSLGLAPTMKRMHIGFMGCHAAINALRAAQNIVESDAGSRVLLAGVELSSLHLHRSSRRDQLVASCIFGDGAAAAIVSARPGGPYRLVDTASLHVPGTSGAMAWTIGERAFEMSLSDGVPALLAEHVPRLMPRWCESLRSDPEALRSRGLWCIHPGGPRVLSEVMNALDLASGSDAGSREILRRYGNMSSTTTLFILDRMRREAVEASTPCVALAFGPGLVIESAMLIRERAVEPPR